MFNAYDLQTANRKIAQAIQGGGQIGPYVKEIQSVIREYSVLDRLYPPEIKASLDDPGIYMAPDNKHRRYMLMKIAANAGTPYYISAGNPVPATTVTQGQVAVYNSDPLSFNFVKPILDIINGEYNIIEEIWEIAKERIGDQKDKHFFEAVRKIVVEGRNYAKKGYYAQFLDAQYFKNTKYPTYRVFMQGFSQPNTVVDSSAGTVIMGIKDVLVTMKSKAASLRVQGGTWVIPEQTWNFIATWTFEDAGTLPLFLFTTGSLEAVTQNNTVLNYKVVTTSKAVNIEFGDANEVQGPININVLGVATEKMMDSDATTDNEVPGTSMLYLVPPEDMFGLHAEVEPITQEGKTTHLDQIVYQLIYYLYYFLGIGISRAYFLTPIYIEG